VANQRLNNSFHPQKGQTPATCKAIAESGGGARSFDEFGTACWSVYGKAIKINPIMHSIKEGAMITNMNFQTSGGSAPAQTPSNLNGGGSNSGGVFGASSGGNWEGSGWTGSTQTGE
jgi:hypothetical protein